VIELYNGIQYDEGAASSAGPVSAATADPNAQRQAGSLTRSRFEHYKMVESLSSFAMRKTDEEQFKYHAYMNNFDDLRAKADSIQNLQNVTADQNVSSSQQFFTYAYKETYQNSNPVKEGSWIDSTLAVPVSDSLQKAIVQTAISASTNMESYAAGRESTLKAMQKSKNEYSYQAHRKFTDAISCLIMFLIGAPLGAIIKKGGFGVPVLISIVFYIVMYIMITQGEKWVKSDLVPVYVGAWLANAILLLVGLYFVNRAKNDSRIFETDNYLVYLERIKHKWNARRQKSALSTG
jgi:lipopolysaccharide export system permease protein